MTLIHKVLFTGVMAFCLLSGSIYAEDDHFHFFRNGKLESVLVVKKEAPRQVSSAVKMFTSLVKRATGKTMIASVKPVPGKNNIILHWEERKLHDVDRFSIRFPKKDRMVITGSPESIGHALEYVLEHAFSVRRLMINYTNGRLRQLTKRTDRSMEVSCEKVEKAFLARKTVNEKPSFNFKRQIYGHILSGWKSRNSFPGIHAMTLWAFPYDKYVVNDSWPKEILPIIRGKRFKMPRGTLKEGHYKFNAHWQPCWSNPVSARIASENILEKLDFAKKNGKKVYSVNLDINDNGGCCQCRNCLDALKKDRAKGKFVKYSNLYWKWVNDIAGRVTKKYPDVYFNCLAYREVIDPPGFKLHPNVIPQICRELSACLDPGVKKTIEGIFEHWSRKADVIFLWDYQYGFNSAYLLPRFYFHKQAEYFRMAHRNRVRGMFIESSDGAGFEGAKHYLNAKLMWDINTDVDQTLQEWCEAFAGKKAAPYLLEYLKFWEAYWLRPEIRKTNWFSSAPSIYMQLNEQGTYTYALRKGEMAKLRRLLEKALANAQTSDQKKRLDLYLNKGFAIAEAAVKNLYSEYLRPDGTVGSAGEAVLLLKSVPDAVEASHFLKTGSFLYPRLYGIVDGALVSNINAVTPFRKDPAVQRELAALIKNKTLPGALRTQLQILAGKEFKNLYPAGSFESAGDFIPRGMKLGTAYASHGKKAVRFRNGGFDFTIKGIKGGKTYYVAADVYASKASSEGQFDFLLAPRVGNRNMDWKRIDKLRLAKGWQTVSFACRTPLSRPVHRKIDNFCLRLQARHFEQDEMLWLDNIRVYLLD